MKKQIIKAMILLIVIVGFLWGGIAMQRQYETYEASRDELLQLENRTTQLQQELDSLTASSAEEMSARTAQLQQETEGLRQQVETLQTEIGVLNDYLEENSGAIAAQQEELAYLQDVYEALDEGMAYVKQLIAES